MAPPREPFRGRPLLAALAAARAPAPRRWWSVAKPGRDRSRRAPPAPASPPAPAARGVAVRKARAAWRPGVTGLAGLVWLAGADCGPPPPEAASSAELAAYRARRGQLVAAETTFAGMRGRYAAYRVRLTSGTGLVATGRLLRPLGSAGPHAAALLNDGRELDSRAVDYLPPEFGDVVVLSLDYPAEFPYEVDLSTAVLRQRRLRAAARQIPALFSLGGAYLARRADVDSARVAIVATSFAVPFAVIAAAADERFRNVGLIYGAGDLAGVLAANLEMRPRRARGLAARVAMRPFREFTPERFAPHVAPRPIVMVNGHDDPQMPRSAVEALYAAAREPKALIWLRTGHLLPTDTALVRALVDTALSRMPVLAGATRATPGRPAAPRRREAAPGAATARPSESSRSPFPWARRIGHRTPRDAT